MLPLPRRVNVERPARTVTFAARGTPFTPKDVYRTHNGVFMKGPYLIPIFGIDWYGPGQPS